MAGVGFVRASSGLAISKDQALVELAKAARDILLEVAATYRGTISYRQLGIDTQRRAAIRCGSTPGWLAGCLAMVAHVCHRLAEPALTSLVVNHEDGTVGEPFDEVLRTAGLPAPSSAEAREQAAAASRLECYRRYAPGVPDDAVPTLVTPQAAQRTPRVKGAPAPRVQRTKPIDASRPLRPADENRAAHVLCSSCFLQTPPGAECQNCGAPL